MHEYTHTQTHTHAGSLDPGLSQPDPEGVLCPCCLSTNLVQLHGHITCPNERWQLDLRGEGLTLEHLKERLAHAYQVTFVFRFHFIFMQ